MAVISKDLGAVTAYAAAVNRGYTGTKEEFETLMASYATVAQQAAESAQSASSSAQGAFQAASSANAAMNNARTAESNAQSAASGAQGYAQYAQQSAQSASQSARSAESAKDTAVNAVDGFAVGAQQALDSVNQAGINWKSLAQAQALDSEAWAVGTRGGEDVGAQDATYHNNAKYYAESAGTSATTATTKASEAAQSAANAASSVAAAEDAADRAEAAAEQAEGAIEVDDTLSVKGRAADAKETGNKITSLKEDLKSQLQAYEVDIVDTALWEQGNINASNGTNIRSSNAIRTKEQILSNAYALVTTDSYRAVIYAYNGSTFVGIWNGTGFDSSVHYFRGFALLPSDTGYTFRLTLIAPTASTAIVPSEASHIKIVCSTDETLTKSGKAADAKVTGQKFNSVETAVSNTEDNIDELDEATFVYGYSEKALTDISNALPGYNTSVYQDTTIALGANANYDTYYWFAEKNTKLYVDATGVAYVALCIGSNPSESEFIWSSASAATLPCESAYRVRKPEGNLPTADNPIVLSKGDVVAITVTAMATCPVFLWEKTNVAKVDTITANGVACDVQASTVTITGDSYKVIFSKLTTTQGHQWNITSLSGADGQNMFPAGVDIIGVIQFVGGSNFMGGGHGNESNYEFRVMADGADVSGTVVKDEIHIIMSSHLYDPDNTSSNVVDRFVEFVFTTKGWTCRNTFKILVNAQIQVAYPSGLFAFTASDCDGAYSNVGTLNLASTSNRQLESVDFKEITMNLPGKFTLNLHSETADKGFVAYRSNTASFKVYFANAELETVTAGDFISGKCEYRF